MSKEDAARMGVPWRHLFVRSDFVIWLFVRLQRKPKVYFYSNILTPYRQVFVEVILSVAG